MDEECGGEIIFFIIAGTLLVFFMMAMVYWEVHHDNIVLSHEIANIICQKLTGNKSAKAMDWWDFPKDSKPIEKGELYCKLPSYTSTQKIKVGH